MKVLVGLSGGVDSSVTAALLKEKGFNVAGVTMKIWDNSFKSSNLRSACYGADEVHDIEDAQKVANDLNIPFHVIDLSKEYKDNIVTYFKNEYLSGRTPNPCVMCNQNIKFYALLEKAKESGIKFDVFATGHYAKVEYDKKTDRYFLKKAKYTRKDQSYFLSFLSQEQLSKVMFPLGKFTKEAVRAKAESFGLFVHDKKESQDFFSGDYNELLNNPESSGPIINSDGKVLGKHNGIWNYTIGQRKGLGISYKAPLYVTRIDKENNAIIVGLENELYSDELTVTKINWISIHEPNKPFNASAKIRYMHKEAEALITPLSNREVQIKFKEPQRSIAPGQISVFYDKDIVLGGGIIK